MNALVVGTGNIIYFVARGLLSRGYRVTLICPDADECVRLSRRLSATVVCGDPTDPRVLDEAEAERCGTLLAVTGSDQDNLAVCQLAQHQYGVPRTVAVVNDPDNERILGRLGVNAVVSPTRLLTELLEQRVESHALARLLPVGENLAVVSEVTIGAGSEVVGHRLRELDLHTGGVLACVLRDGAAVIPRGETVLQAGDRVIVVALPADYGAIERRLTGEAV